MSSLADLPELVGFFSYSREDDEAFKGSLSALRDGIQRELSAQLGRSKRTFRLWQDMEAIAPGTLWESEIKTAVAQAVFFIPIVTPRAVNSDYCKFEFEAFLARERALGRADLVFPILYIAVQALEEESRWRNHPVLSIVGVRQYVDWRPYRHLDVETTVVREAIERFCDKIVHALNQSWVSPEERQEREARQRLESEHRQREVEATRRAEEDARRQREEEDARRRAEEGRRQAQDAQRAAEEADRRKQAEAEARQRAADERRSREAAAKQRAQAEQAFTAAKRANSLAAVDAFLAAHGDSHRAGDATALRAALVAREDARREAAGSEEAPPLSEREHRTQLRRAVVASTIGSALVWYDFFLYGMMAGVFSRTFFPATDPLAAGMLTVGTYGLGLAARPLGAALFGRYGDRRGRRPALVASLLLMGIATFLMGLVPSYASSGAVGPLVLTFLRLVQGIGVGGEWGGAVLMSMEWARGPKRRGLIASWPQIGAPCGLLLATFAVGVSGAMAGSDFPAWGWRVPFFFSLLLVAIGLYARLRVRETPVFRRLVAEHKIDAQPVLTVIEQNLKEIILGVLVRVGEQAPFYIFTAFVFSYGIGTLHLERNFLLAAVQLATVAWLVTIPLFGYLSDLIGRKRMYMIGAGTMGVFGFIYFAMVGTGSEPAALLAIVLSLLVHAMMFGPQAALIAESFPARLRYSGASLAVQLAGIIAVFAPAITAALFAQFQSPYLIALYILGCAVVSLIAAAMMMDRTGKDIDAD
jgi:MFS family permease